MVFIYPTQMIDEEYPVLLNVKFTRNNIFLNVTENGQQQLCIH